MRRRSGRWLAAGLALGLAALLRGSAGAQAPWSLLPLEEARQTGTFHDRSLTESSGVIVSPSQPGILWTINDSDGRPRIFATDTLGRNRGRFLLDGVANVDWEAITAGPCGSAICLYIADVGDNLEQRASVQLYRFPEPDLTSRLPRPRSVPAPDRLEVTYPDGPRDVEAAFVDGRGDVHLISKGRTVGFRHYRVRSGAWNQDTAAAEPLGFLSIEKGPGLGRLVTDAAIAPGGAVAVRTYQEIFVFQLTSRGMLRPTGAGCSLGGLELQGEGVAWLDPATVVLTSEGLLSFPGTISVGRCPAVRRKPATTRAGTP